MDICLIYTSNEAIPQESLVFGRGILAYKALGNILYSTALPKNLKAELMLVTLRGASPYVAPGIYDECRKRSYSSVFLDCKSGDIEQDSLCELSGSLIRRGLKVYIPEALAGHCNGAVPVFQYNAYKDTLKRQLDYITKQHKKPALSIPVICNRHTMPHEDDNCKTLSFREAMLLKSRCMAESFYSPALSANYFIFQDTDKSCGFCLFDDANSISRKIRLAKQYGIDTVFLVNKEISDFSNDIILA